MESRGRTCIAVVLALALSATGCAATPPGDDSGNGLDPQSDVVLPPGNAAPDYQLGGAYDPDPAVGIVARDRTAQAASGIYSICYVNAFQTQPAEQDLWPADLLLQDADGEPLIDPNWPDEVLVDTSTEQKRSAIVELVAAWIRGCAESGFDAVEFDNLDSFTRSADALSAADNQALATGLVLVAHDAGLAAGQKNAAEQSAAMHRGAGFDFAVAEECVAFAECGLYTEVYGDHVIAIEYSDTLDRPFADACADPETPASVVLRDRDLVTPTDAAYVFELC